MCPCVRAGSRAIFRERRNFVAKKTRTLVNEGNGKLFAKTMFSKFGDYDEIIPFGANRDSENLQIFSEVIIEVTPSGRREFALGHKSRGNRSDSSQHCADLTISWKKPTAYTISFFFFSRFSENKIQKLGGIFVSNWQIFRNLRGFRYKNSVAENITPEISVSYKMFSTILILNY